MGGEGLRRATEVAVLNANYIARRLQEHYPILYTGPGGLVAHECILDVRPLTRATGVTVDDVAKRLIDYGFHAPTMSFPVAGTLMVEPTESEDLGEIDRFCDAMIAIRGEIERVASGEWTAEDSPLRHAPHTAQMLVGEWPYPYTREEAVFPVEALRSGKYWPPVRRIDGAYGDRNLVCTCPPIEALRGSPALALLVLPADAPGVRQHVALGAGIGVVDEQLRDPRDPGAAADRRDDPRAVADHRLGDDPALERRADRRGVRHALADPQLAARVQHGHARREARCPSRSGRAGRARRRPRSA